MAENAPTVFNVHVPVFVDAVWVALRDPSVAVRERAVEALRACLCVIEKRETRWRVQWYYRMFEATQVYNLLFIRDGIIFNVFVGGQLEITDLVYVDTPNVR